MCAVEILIFRTYARKFRFCRGSSLMDFVALLVRGGGHEGNHRGLMKGVLMGGQLGTHPEVILGGGYRGVDGTMSKECGILPLV